MLNGTQAKIKNAITLALTSTNVFISYFLVKNKVVAFEVLLLYKKWEQIVVVQIIIIVLYVLFYNPIFGFPKYCNKVSNRNYEFNGFLFCKLLGGFLMLLKNNKLNTFLFIKIWKRIFLLHGISILFIHVCSFNLYNLKNF